MINNKTGKSFYAPRVQRTIVVPASHNLTFKHWTTIGAALSRRTAPPVWYDYLMSGRQRMDAGDLKATVIDFAIAAESGMRRYLDQRIPLGAPDGIRRVVARTNMSNILNQWRDLGGLCVHPQTVSNVKALFDVRNGLMHRGAHDRVNETFCAEVSKGVENLLDALRL